MAICRVEKTKNYTTMSNYHLDDKNLSLKAIGLLSKMLRLPDSWDFSIKGLATICKDGTESISSALKELEKNHYIKRERERDEFGCVKNMVYYVYEVPYDINKTSIINSEFIGPSDNKEGGKTAINSESEPKWENPVQENPVQENPVQENPVLDNPVLDNPVLDNPDLDFTPQINNKKTSTYKTRTNQSIFQGLYAKKSEPELPDQDETYERLNELKKHFNFSWIQQVNDQLDEDLENDVIDIEEYDEKWINIEYAESILLGIAESLSYEGKFAIVQGNKFCGKDVLMDKINLLNEFDFQKIVKRVFDVRPKNKQLYAIKTLCSY